MKRYLIIDFNHMAWVYAHGHMQRLTYTVQVNGVPVLLDTTVPSGIAKTLNRWSAGDTNLIVCFDSPCKPRRAYFANQKSSTGGTTAYKAGRKGMGDAMFQAIQTTRDMLNKAGVSTIQADGYEADDLIMAAIQKIRSTGDYTTPIDVVTNDADLVPLVDEQISVFLRSRTSTYAESKDLEKTKYVQIRPHNYQEVIQNLSAFKNPNLNVPYNTLLLVKILRGDPSDNIQGYGKDLPPRHLNEIVQIYSDAASTSFVYGMTDAELEEALSDLRAVLAHFKDLEPKAKYNTDDVISHVERLYRGMDLNVAFAGVPGQEGTSRKVARARESVRYSFPDLYREALTLGIHLTPPV